MDIDTRLLRYFLAIAREGNMTRAAGTLHVTQPTLSKQMTKLEEMLETNLFIRANNQMLLSEDGLRFRERAREIIELTDKTLADMRQGTESINGEVAIGSAESDGFRFLIQIMKELTQAHPQITFDIFSGNSVDTLDRLDKGLMDFALVVGIPNLERYHTVALPVADHWGVLLRKDDPLSQHAYLTPQLLKDQPLILSKQAYLTNELSGWMGEDSENFNVVATFNLLNNAALLAEEGMGYVLSLDKIINTSGDSPLCFRPFRPIIEAGLALVWRKGVILSPAADAFLETFRNQID